METKEIKISEETKDIYMLYQELREILEKVSNWYEKEYGCKDDNKANDIIMSNFYDKLTESFDTADSFVLNLFMDRVRENTCLENGIL